MELEIWQLARLARRWWWLLVLGPVIGALVAFAVSTREQAEYTAVALLRINPAQISGVIDFDDLHNGETLAATYRLLIWTPQVLTPVIEELGLDEDTESLGSQISAWPIAGTQLMQVSVVDRDSERAAAIANAAAASLARHVSQGVESLSEPVQERLEAQIAETQTQIEATSEQLRALEADAGATDAQLDALSTTLDQLRQRQADLSQTAQLLDLDAALATNQMSVAAAAVPPTESDASSPVLLTVFGAAAGLLVGAAVVAVLGFMDRTVRAGTDFAALVGLPQLSAVPDDPRLADPAGRLVMLSRPDSATAEAIRLLRVNLGLAAGDDATGTGLVLAVTSPGPREGKSTIAANLAIALAQTGVPVVLVDANLRDPSLHTLFDVSGKRGLASVLSGDVRDWKAAAVQVAVPGLQLLAAGATPASPADLLSHERFSQLLKMIGESAVVVLDTPAIEAGSDAIVVADAADSALLIGRAGQTRTEALQGATAALRPTAARLLGVVLNGETERVEGVSRPPAARPEPAADASPAVLNLDPGSQSQ